MTARRLVVVLLLGAGLLSAPPVRAQPRAPSGPERGRALFLADCAVCHGRDGRADTPVARLLDPHPRKVADPIEMARVSDDRQTFQRGQ